MNFTGTGWYLISNTRSNTWNDMKLAEGLIMCSVYEYIYSLSGSPITPNTSLSVNNLTPIDVSNANNPSLTVGTNYWVNITYIPPPSFSIVDGTSATFSGTGSISSSLITSMIQSSGYTQATVQSVTSIRFYGFNRINATGLSEYSGDGVSQNVPNVLTISIASSVKTIGDNAFVFFPFKYLSSVTSIIFEGNCQITSIGANAFSGFIGLTSFTIPTSVTTLGLNALQSVGYSDYDALISDNLTSIGAGAFAGASIRKFFVYPTNPNYSGIDALFNKNQTTLIQYASTGYNNVTYQIPSTVTTIGAYSLSGIQITNVTIPNSVTIIEEYAFSGGAFTQQMVIPASVVSIGKYAFQQMINMPYFSVNSNNTYYSSDGAGVLFNYEKSRLIQYPGSRNASSYTIPSTVEIVDGYAFANVSSNSTMWGTSVFTTVVLPSSASQNIGLRILEYAFANTQLSTCEFSTSNVTVIGDYAFYGTNLSHVTFPVSIVSIGNNAFTGMYTITAVTFNGDSAVQNIDYNAFQGNITLTISAYTVNVIQGNLSPGYYKGYIPPIFANLPVPIGTGEPVIVNLSGKERIFAGANVLSLTITA